MDTVQVAVVTDLAGKQRRYPHAPIDGDGWGTGSNGLHRSYFYFDGCTPARALELAAYRAAALCIDPIALEASYA
jgi:hypothetical protein